MVTLTCELRPSGVTAAPAFPGATDTDMFETYEVAIRDDLKPHKSEEAVEAAGARVIPPPSRNPADADRDEISKIKGARNTHITRLTPCRAAKSH